MTDWGQWGPFSPGDKLLEQYEVTRLLGMGGHAYVYECRDRFLDELLAVKVIPNPPNRGRELLDRARAEAQLLRRLSHPNVVRMHTAAALGDDMVCLVMEKLAGINLRHLLALLGRLSITEAAAIVRQVAVGVAAAHELNVVHRDIKPDNIFVLPPNNHVKVLDFGIAKFLGRGLQTSNKYKFQGTPLYMSPEHLKGTGVTARSDVYQLGTVFFELIAGINPNLLDLSEPGFEQVAFVQITRPTPPLSSLLTSPPGLDALIGRATAKNPDDRYASMPAFIDDLDRVMRDYLTVHPHEVSKIRYIDDALVNAAQVLTARETAGEDAAIATTVFNPLSRKATQLSGSGASDAVIGSDTEPFSLPASSDLVASFHPVPTQTAQSPSILPDTTPPRRRTTRAPKESSSISLGFVVTALGFGAILGLLILWLVPRNIGAAAPSSSGTVELAPERVRPSASGRAELDPVGPTRTDAALATPSHSMQRAAIHDPKVHVAAPTSAPHASTAPSPVATLAPVAAPTSPSDALQTTEESHPSPLRSLTGRDANE
ncbi:MAG TPA: protein kinase [Polyangiaceae bacterium]